jgi:hypothetical protein
MITDINLRISTDQVLTGITNSTALSSKSIDLSIARDIGEGKPLFMNFAITTACTDGTSTEFQIVVADDAALSSNLVVIGSSGAVPVASLVAGANFPVPIPPKVGSLGKRYLGARYAVVGTNTTGKVTADIVEAIQDGKKFYASGFSVS